MKREWCATVAGTDHEIQVELGDDGRWQVVGGERERHIDAREVSPGCWSLLVDGESWVVNIDHGKKGTSIQTRSTHTRLEIQDSRRKRLAATAQRDGGEVDGEVVRAPIAGKVVKLLVEDGARVEPGQSVAVLEAMKMENEIKAVAAGTVKQIHVSAGQSVETQEALLTIA